MQSLCRGHMLRLVAPMNPSKDFNGFTSARLPDVIVGLDHVRELLETDTFELHEGSGCPDKMVKVLDRQKNNLPFLIRALVFRHANGVCLRYDHDVLPVG